ncbi:MAG: UbiD family decarboxylase [Deltaproteobacteria bacterium]|nr:UbiD family decarboxylase [Deltaproteobacteria bacterium]
MGLAQRKLHDLNGMIEFLARTGDLARVRSEVDLKHELAGVAARFEGGKAVLFTRLKGHSAQVFTGLYWNRRILARLCDVAVEELPFLMADAVAAWKRSPIDPVVLPGGPANEVVEREPDLTRLPIPVHAVKDGGAYIDSSIVIARDPDTGVRNASIQRFMVAGRDRLVIEMDLGRHLRDYYERAEKQGVPLEITINNGVDLGVHMAAVTPAVAAPIDMDELGVASQLLGEPLQLVAGQTVGVEGVAHAQYIIEAEMLPHAREPEGPFAEVTGYYATRGDREVVRVKAVTHRREPIWHTIISGKEVYNAVGLTAEANIYKLVSSQIPGVKAVYLTHGGCGFYHAVVQLRKRVEGVGKNAIMAVFAAFPSLKMVIAVDDDVDIYNAEDVEWAIATRCRPARDVLVIPHALCHELNPTTEGSVGSKLGIDATAPYPPDPRYERAKMLDVKLEDYEIE